MGAKRRASKLPQANAVDLFQMSRSVDAFMRRLHESEACVTAFVQRMREDAAAATRMLELCQSPLGKTIARHAGNLPGSVAMAILCDDAQQRADERRTIELAAPFVRNAGRGRDPLTKWIEEQVQREPRITTSPLWTLLRAGQLRGYKTREWPGFGNAPVRYIERVGGGGRVTYKALEERLRAARKRLVVS